MYDPKAKERAIAEQLEAAKKPVPATTSAKLEAGWRYVTVPAVDVYDYKFKGIGLNHKDFGPGTHLVPPDEADYLEERLRVWNASMVRMLRPTANKPALDAVNKRGESGSPTQVTQAPIE